MIPNEKGKIWNEKKKIKGNEAKKLILRREAKQGEKVEAKQSEKEVQSKLPPMAR